MKRILFILMFLFIPLAYAETYTSLLAEGYDIDPFTITLDTYTEYISETFSVDSSTHFVLLSSMNLKGLGTPSNNEVWVRIKVDGDIELTEKLRVVRAANEEGATGTQPIEFDVTSGDHIVTMEFLRTESNNVEVNDIDLSLIQTTTNAGGTVRQQIIDADYSYTSNSFIPAFNWTVTKTIDSPTFITTKQTVESSAPSTTIEHYFENLDDLHTSPFWTRFLEGASDTGSAAGSYIETDDNPTHDYTIQSKSDKPAGTITVNSTILDLDLRDTNTYLINNFQASNASTYLDNTITLSAGSHKLAEATITIQDGTGVLLSMTSSFESTAGPQTPVYIINSSDVSCTSKKERDLSSATDVGNVFIYFICDGLTVGNSYTFELWVDNTVNLEQYDESLNAFEVNGFETEDPPVPVIPEFSDFGIGLIIILVGAGIIFIGVKKRKV